MLEYAFMRKALLVGMLLGLIIPLMGVLVINRRTSTVGDALSHTSLAGIGIGLLIGFDPIIGSIGACVLGALSIESVRRRFPGHGDMATAIVTSTGVGLASILSDIVPTTTNFESYLFGSIIAISDMEVVISIIMSIAIFVMFFLMYYQMIYISIDDQGARISGVAVSRVELLFTLLLAISIAISSRIIGVLMVSSLMILPVASAMAISRSYRATVLKAMIFGVSFILIGLTISFYGGIKPGGAIVLTGVACFLLTLLYNLLRGMRARKL